MQTGIILFVSLFVLIAVISLLSWGIRLEGRILLRDNRLDYSGIVALGGIAVTYSHGSPYLVVGRRPNPLIELKIGAKKKTRRKKGRGWKRISFFRTRKLIKQILRSVKWETVSVKGELGLDNPFLTGQIFGAMMAISGCIPRGIGEVELIPCFTERKLNFDCRSTFRIRPAVLAWRVGSAFLTRTH